MTVLAYNSITTLARIRAKRPCEYGWRKLLASMDKSKADDEPLPLLTVLDSNGLDDALWVLSYAMPDDRLSRHFRAWCAEQVLHFFEAERPDDKRPRHAIEVARDDSATPEARVAARAAARDAARDAAWAAARAAAWAAAGGAAWDAAWDAAWAAAGGAAGGAARAAARDAAWGAAWGAAGGAAGGAARGAQEAQLRAMISEETDQ